MDTYTLKNFRVFDEKGATLKMAPLTILTGCNGSGKSSITKSMMLLQPFFKEICSDIIAGKIKNLSSYTLDFARGGHRLGAMERAINWQSKNKEFSVCYSFFSWILSKNLDVELVFSPIVNNSSANESLRAHIRKMNIYVKDSLLYSYENTSDADGSGSRILSNEESSWCNVGSNKELLIDAINDNDLSSLVYEIFDSCQQIDRDDYIRDEVGIMVNKNYKWGKKDLDSISGFVGESNVEPIVYGGIVLRHLCGKSYLNYKENFKHTDCIRKDDKGVIDFMNSDNQYDFSSKLIFPLHKLGKEMDSVSKDDFVSWAERKFVKSLTTEWYNTETYKNIIIGFATEFAESNFEKFSDFYLYYENEYLNKTVCSFGSNTACFNEYRTIECGTACVDEAINRIFSDKVSQLTSWKQLKNNREKFAYMFAAIQGFAGYENISCVGIPMEFPLEKAIDNIICMTCAEALGNTNLLTEASFIDINRANQQRCYTFGSQGTAFNQLLDDYAHSDEEVTDHNDRNCIYKKGDFARKWLKKLTNVDDFSLELAPEGIGYYVYLTRSVKGVARKTLLADMGFGITPLLSILLHLEVIITRQLRQFDNMDYASYILPTIICIEEPESNLHPKFQSLLADIFADVVTMKCKDRVSPEIRIMLETHSEYLIRRLQVLVAEKNLRPDTVAIHYLYDSDVEMRPDDEKDQPQVKIIEIEEDGSLTDSFGSGFFDETIKSYSQLIKL